ncbi:MAG: NAD(P)H-dependent oxidoreductase [Deltaproteobacteria bacterium]|nr:NAD(P)H-dependent oxidoreductase [Deltaproteobacteria bacterium]
MRRILVIDAHPRAGSFCAALATAYVEESRRAGAEVDRLDLRDLRFDPMLRDDVALEQPLEPDLEQAQRRLAAAEHLVLVYPIWWGSYPALLKAFLDRAMLPGFAFKYRPQGRGWDKLLAGRSARVISTMDTPPLLFRLLMGSPAHRAMGRATLGFCGVKPVRFTDVGSVKGSTPAQRQAWLGEARKLGRQEAR